MLFRPKQLKFLVLPVLQFLVHLPTVHLWGFPKLFSLQYLIWLSVELIWAATAAMTYWYRDKYSAYSGTVAGAREAFFNGIPSLSLSYDWVGGKSNINDFTLAAEACLPIITAVLAKIEKKTLPRNCFLNIDVPTDVVNHKGYRLTRQGKSIVRMGWKQVDSDAQGGKMLSTMTIETNSPSHSESYGFGTKQENLLFKREVRGSQVEEGDTDYSSLQEGYIAVSPLGALSPPDTDGQAYFKQWLPRVASAL